MSIDALSLIPFSSPAHPTDELSSTFREVPSFTPPAFQNASFSWDRPLLPPPSSLEPTSFMKGIGRFLERLHEIDLTLLRAGESALNHASAQDEALFERHKLEDKKMQDALKSAEWWDILRKVFTTLINATAIITGILSKNYTMVATGLAGTAGTILSEIQKDSKFALALTLASGALSVGGSFSLFSSGAVSAKDAVFRIVTTAFGIGSATANIHANVREMRLSLLKGDYGVITGNLEELSGRLHQLQQEMSAAVDTTNRIYTQCSDIKEKETRVREMVIAFSAPNTRG